MMMLSLIIISMKTKSIRSSKLLKGKKALSSKWVYQVKEENNGSKKYKARLLVKIFQQKEGIGYTEIFSLLVKFTTIRIVLELVAKDDLHLRQLDINIAFLHGGLEKEVYMQQSQGFKIQRKGRMVCKLQKNLYSLKQARQQ